MSISISQVRRDLKEYSQKSMSVELTFTPPSGSPATILGYGTVHHLSFDPQTGRAVNSKNAHCSFAESLLTDAGYTVRVLNEVSMKNHKVRFKDSAGITRNYKINETFPDETLGLIVCILGDQDAS